MQQVPDNICAINCASNAMEIVILPLCSSTVFSALHDLRSHNLPIVSLQPEQMSSPYVWQQTVVSCSKSPNDDNDDSALLSK